MNIALKFAYDGRNFYGYARQPKLRTVEGEIINNLIDNNFIESVKNSSFRSASRTDKKVSAFCNVISFKTNKTIDNILEYLSNLFEDIIFYGEKQVNLEFYPRYAKQRQYRYYLCSKNLDTEKIISASSVFTGKNDFSNFARVEKHKNPIRIIDNIVFSELDDFLIIDFFAQNYLWQQVRRIVSALEKVGNYKIKKEQLSKALKNPDKKVDFGVASPEQLILKNVIYDFEFNYNKIMLDKAKKLEQKIIFY
jgi:tRNA pseudouridine38-40 synthase